MKNFVSHASTPTQTEGRGKTKIATNMNPYALLGWFQIFRNLFFNNPEKKLETKT